MKLAKMSLAAALLLGVNAYAIDNVKVNGDVKVNYQTVDSDVTGAADLFDKDASAADVALHLGLTADLSEGVSAGISMTAVSTLGVENNLVSNTWSGAHGRTTNGITSVGAQMDDAEWIDEAWIAGTAGKTTAKLGRQSLDTPLVFTETWGIDKNTFEAAVLLNQDIEDTTLVAAYVGKSNGNSLTSVSPSTGGVAGYVNAGGKFDSFHNGAYAFGAINNSLEALTAQAWYYDVQGIAKAYWLQADVNMEGILFGAQYTNVDSTDGILASADEDTAYAVMLGYAMKDTVTVKAAFSSVDDKGAIGVGNVATNANATTTGSTGQSKLYTEMWWNYGQVSATGSDSFAISAEGTVSDIDLFAAYYMSEQDTAGNDTDVNEIALTATKSYGPLDTTVAILHDDIDREVGVDQKDLTLQVYLTYNF